MRVIYIKTEISLHFLLVNIFIVYKKLYYRGTTVYRYENTMVPPGDGWQLISGYNVEAGEISHFRAYNDTDIDDLR